MDTNDLTDPEDCKFYQIAQLEQVLLNITNVISELSVDPCNNSYVEASKLVVATDDALTITEAIRILKRQLN